VFLEHSALLYRAYNVLSNSFPNVSIVISLLLLSVLAGLY